MRSVKVYEEARPLHTPFVISRGSRNEACVVVVECEEDGVKASGNVPLILATEKARRQSWRKL